LKSNKPLVWLHGEVKTPPFTTVARIKTGFLLRKLQQGQKLEMPNSRAMPSIGKQCHELRINDVNKTWRIIYCIDDDAIVILEVFTKKSQKTPAKVTEACQKRLTYYNS
jgi:phage-related protein